LDEYQRLNKPKGDPFGGLISELRHLRLLSLRRQSAAKFLALAAPLLPEATRPHLAAAAQHFQNSATEAAHACSLCYGSENESARITQIIFEGRDGDDNPEWVAYWTGARQALAGMAKRKAMAEHLGRVLESERPSPNWRRRRLR